MIGNGEGKTTLSYLKWALISTVIGLALGAWLGWQTTGTLSGMATVFTGGPHLKVADVRDTIVSTFKYPSIDQIAANHYMNETPTAYRSLEAAITRFRGTDEGTTFQHLSHNGPNDVNPSEESPQAMFEIARFVNVHAPAGFDLRLEED